jgi:N-acetylmuramoyl-L-alanine amidase
MKKIRIDPGHHDQRDNRVQGYSEAATMLAIGKKLKSYADTVMARGVKGKDCTISKKRMRILSTQPP